MKNFVRSTRSSSKYHQLVSAPATSLVDDTLNEMLVDVDVSKTTYAEKPLKVSRKRPRLELETKEAPIQVDFGQMSTQESEVKEEESNNDGTVEATHLSDDLKKNVDFISEDDKEFCRFYWYDCCEDTNRYPGSVYLFGRMPVNKTKYVSSCVIVKNMKRTCYLLIGSDSTYEDVVAEFKNITAKQFKIRDFTCEKVTKKYAFSADSTIPLVADYVKLDYPSNQAAIPQDFKGQTFTHVLNTNQTPMEKLILDLKLRGPCWLRLVNPSEPIGGKLTHTRIELIINNPENLLVEEKPEALGTPYFSAFAFSLRIYTNPISHGNEIIAIALMYNSCIRLDECLNRKNKASGHFIMMAKPSASNKELKIPYDFQAVANKKKNTKSILEIKENERDLLMGFMEKFVTLDPDIVIGHELLSCDYETLLSRMKFNKVPGWSQLGRFPRSEYPATKTAFRNMFTGRIMCDIEVSAKELIHARSYDLTELASQVLNVKRTEFTHEAIVESYKTSESLMNLLNATWDNTDIIFSILVELNVIPLALKITTITGGVLSRTLSGGRSERNDYLLLHAFHEDNYICPEKQAQRFTNNKKAIDTNEPVEFGTTRRKAAYSGGLVLEPKSGYYDTCILLMDFNSLYPSIIQEFNICFSTVKVPKKPENIGVGVDIIADLPEESSDLGILPAQLKKLVDGRRSVKRHLAEASSESQKILLDIEQKALKLTANSMYGCLGFEYCRFYGKHLASLVTFKGREILMSTKAMVEKLGYEVIYGDTDSLMIDTKIVEYDEVINKGNAIKSEINRTFRLLEIDIDGVFRPLLLLKKKNYAGVSIKKVNEEMIRKVETKGIDTVRRDRAIIAREAGEHVLSMILSGDKDIVQTVEDIHSYLKQLGADVAANSVPQEKFLISKSLNRNPEDYRDTKGIGHVTLALRHNQNPKNTKKLRAGHTLEYVICVDDTDQSANQRAYTLQEMAANPILKIDTEYYLCQQIHPVITRICEKLPITNAYVLAEMLGIESSKLLHIRRDDTEATMRDQLASKGSSRFNLCKPLKITCPNCNLPVEVQNKICQNKEKKTELSLTKCSQCGIRYAMRAKQVISQVIAIIRRLTVDLYASKFICENPECNRWTRNVFGPMTNNDDFNEDSVNPKANPICSSCQGQMRPEFNDREMDRQLGFFKHLFDVSRDEPELRKLSEKVPEDVRDMYNSCLKEVDYALKSSYINNIDTFTIFSMICSGGQNSIDSRS